MKKAVIAFVIAISPGTGCQSTAPGNPEVSAPVTVTTTRATIEDVGSPFEAGGVVRSRATAVIASRVMAPIAQVHVRAGDRVRRGATLVTLDAAAIQAERGRAEAASRSASELARAADADLRAAESAVVLARATHDRIATLHARKSATAHELDQAVAALTAAEAQRTSAQSRLAAAEGSGAAAQASAEAATITATYAVLAAPFDGIVIERAADAGSLATPGSPLLTLEDPTTYRLEVQLDEARAAHVNTGQSVSVHLDNALGEDGGWIEGRVDEIARIDAASHTFLAKIDLPQSSALRSGLFGRARFPGPARRALTAPGSALIKRGQLTFVYLVADGHVRLRPISTGHSVSGRVEVLAGLRDGDEVVVNPAASLTDGARISEGKP